MRRLSALIVILLASSTAVAAPSAPPASPPGKSSPAQTRPDAAPGDEDAAPGDEDAAPGDSGAKPLEDTRGTPSAMTPKIKKKNLSHRLQVSVDIAVGLGYSNLVVYDTTTTWCGKVEDDGGNASFCPGMAPVMIDFGLGFSVLDSLEILAEFRLALTRDMVGNRPLAFMPGLRLWIDPKLPFKIGLAIQVVLDFTEQGNLEQLNHGMPEKGEALDVGARFYAQFQYDFLRYVGIFGRIGLIGLFQRWVQINLEAQLGVQARFP